MTYLHLSMHFDRNTGVFHHYEVWRANAQTAFLAHVANLVPGTSYGAAKDFIKGLS